MTAFFDLPLAFSAFNGSLQQVMWQSEWDSNVHSEEPGMDVQIKEELGEDIWKIYWVHSEGSMKTIYRTKVDRVILRQGMVSFGDAL